MYEFYNILEVILKILMWILVILLAYIIFFPKSAFVQKIVKKTKKLMQTIDKKTFKILESPKSPEKEIIEHQCKFCESNKVYKITTFGNKDYEIECVNCHKKDYIINGDSPNIVEYNCKHCGNNQMYEYNSNTPLGLYGVCTKCYEITVIQPNINNSIKPKIECPYCHSTNTKKISNVSKAAGVAAFGVFALGRTTKEWHCNNCNSNF